MKKLRLFAVVALVLALATFGNANTAVDAEFWVELEPPEHTPLSFSEVARYSNELVFSHADSVFEGRVMAFTGVAYYRRTEGRTYGPFRYKKYDVEVLDSIYASTAAPTQTGVISIYDYSFSNPYSKVDMSISINIGDTYIFIADAAADDDPYRGEGLYMANFLYGVYPVEDSTVYMWHEVPIGDMESPITGKVKYYNSPHSLYPSHREVDRETAKEGLRTLAETYNVGGTL